MKNKWLVVGMAGSLLFIVLFIISVFIATFVSGGGKHLAVGSGVGLVEVKGLIIDSQEIVKQLQ